MEAELIRLGFAVPQDASIRRAIDLHPYLVHYAQELAAYSRLDGDPRSYGFFVPECPVADCRDRFNERAYMPCLPIVALTSLVGDLVHPWAVVEERIHRVYDMLRDVLRAVGPSTSHVHRPDFPRGTRESGQSGGPVSSHGGSFRGRGWVRHCVD